MSFDTHKNFAYGTILTAPTPATSGTSLVLDSGQGVLMPATPFNAVVWPANVLPTAANAEVVRATNRVSDTLTITRTQEASSARAIQVGDQFSAAITAKMLTDIETATAFTAGYGITVASQVISETNAVVALTDGATVALDASLGKVFRLPAGGDRTISVPTNAVTGMKIVIEHFASGGARTLTLTTGSSGAFRFGSDVAALTQTASGKTDYIGCIYNGSDSRWDVVAYVKGY